VCEHFDGDVASRWDPKVEDPALPLAFAADALSVNGALAAGPPAASYLPKRFARGLEKLDCAIVLTVDDTVGEADIFSVVAESDFFRSWSANIGWKDGRLSFGVDAKAFGGGADVGTRQASDGPPKGRSFRIRFELGLSDSTNTVRVTVDDGPPGTVDAQFDPKPKAFTLRVGIPRAVGPATYGVRIDDLVCH
jgi:hypothetical protein